MPAGKSILVVEDEADLAELLRYNLQREGYVCRCARDGASAVPEATRYPPDLIVLDRMLPGLSGDEVISQLRRDPRTAGIAIIMLTAKAEEADALVGFALGADDYVTKPFSMKLLLARVGALLRRKASAQSSEQVLVAGSIRLDTGRYEVTVDEQVIPLTVTEFRLLKAVMAARGRVLSRGQLIDGALGNGTVVTDRAVDVHVTSLRKKLGAAAAWIQTIRGVGYAFREPTDAPP